MSDTPRTDSIAYSSKNFNRLYVDADFARQLERDLAECCGQRDVQRDYLAALTQERDALRELLLQTRDYINHTHQGCAHYKSLHDRCDCGCDDLDERIRAALERKP